MKGRNDGCAHVGWAEWTGRTTNETVYHIIFDTCSNIRGKGTFHIIALNTKKSQSEDSVNESNIVMTVRERKCK